MSGYVPAGAPEVWIRLPLEGLPRVEYVGDRGRLEEWLAANPRLRALVEEAARVRDADRIGGEA